MDAAEQQIQRFDKLRGAARERGYLVDVKASRVSPPHLIFPFAVGCLFTTRDPDKLMDMAELFEGLEPGQGKALLARVARLFEIRRDNIVWGEPDQVHFRLDGTVTFGRWLTDFARQEAMPAALPSVPPTASDVVAAPTDPPEPDSPFNDL